MSRQVVRDTLAFLPAKLVPAAIGFVSIPIYTRLLPVEEYGQYLVAMTGLALISACCTSWIVSITIRFAPVTDALELRRTLVPLLFVSAGAGCAIWAGIVLGTGWQAAAIPLYLVAGAVWLVGQAAFEYHAGWLRAFSAALPYSLAFSWRSAGGLILSIAAVSYVAATGGAVIAGAVAAILLAVPLAAGAARRVRRRAPRIAGRPLALRTALAYGLPVAVSNLVIVGLSVADRYVIGHHLGPQAVAIYGASYDIAEKTVFFANSMLLLSSSVIGVRIFEAEGEAPALAFLESLMRLYLIAATPFVVAMMASAPSIVALVLPVEYAAGGAVLPIVAISGLLVGIMHRYSLLLSLHRRTGDILVAGLVSLTVGLTACWFLSQRFGLLGAAAASAAGYVAMLVTIRLAAGRFACPRFPWATLLRVGVASTVSAAVIIGVRTTLAASEIVVSVLAILAGLACYMAVIALLRELRRGELAAVANIIKRRS